MKEGFWFYIVINVISTAAVITAMNSFFIVYWLVRICFLLEKI